MTDTAARLLDAQVEWAVAELTGDGLAELLAEDVDELLRVGASLPLSAVAQPEAIKGVVRRAISNGADSPLVTALVDQMADAIYAMPAADEHQLGSVVGREHVDAIVTKVLGMHRLHERVMDRMMQSPAVGDIANRFVGRLVGDFVNQNRERVEKLPGAKSMMKIGFGAAKKAQGIAQNSFIGEAAGKGAQFAMKQTNAATREILRDAPLRQAALELWDLQAAETVAALREYATATDVREIAQLVRALVADARDTEYVAALIDTCVDTLFAEHGDTDVATLLADLGIGRDELLTAARDTAPHLLASLRESDELAAVVRRRLAPFYDTDAVRAILGEGADAPAPAPAKKAPATKAPAKKAAAKKAAAKKAPAKKPSA